MCGIVARLNCFTLKLSMCSKGMFTSVGSGLSSAKAQPQSRMELEDAYVVFDNSIAHGLQILRSTTPRHQGTALSLQKS
jgi:hypothetical protein